jgi:hypothetical protein
VCFERACRNVKPELTRTQDVRSARCDMRAAWSVSASSDLSLEWVRRDVWKGGLGLGCEVFSGM